MYCTASNLILVNAKSRQFNPFTLTWQIYRKKRLEGNVYPFKNTGVDYLGPFEVTVLRRRLKHWCCLFTCLVSRTVHIELLNGLDTDACMMVFTRFIARRGRPHKIIIDNGTNFVGAAREFKECFNQWDQDAMCERLAHRQFNWKFNPPGARHFGGIWERLVHSCKKTLFSILGNRRVTLSVLTTTMWLVEQTRNTRPLTSVNDNPEALEALTPNHFLLRRPVVAELLMHDAVRCVELESRKMYRVAQAFNQIIWNKWAKNTYPSGMCDLNGLLTTKVCSKLGI